MKVFLSRKADKANAYRLGVGDYRILYAIIAEDEILVFKISRRETAYLVSRLNHRPLSWSVRSVMVTRIFPC